MFLLGGSAPRSKPLPFYVPRYLFHIPSCYKDFFKFFLFQSLSTLTQTKTKTKNKIIIIIIIIKLQYFVINYSTLYYSLATASLMLSITY